MWSTQMANFDNLWSKSNQQLTDFLTACSICEWCAGTLDSSHPFLCRSCCGQLPYNLCACRQCAEPAQSSLLWRCGPCLQSPPYFDYSNTGYCYLFPIDQWIVRCKDRHSLPWHDRLQYLASSSYEPPTVAIDAVTFIPSNRVKLLQRGFNLSQSLATSVAAQLDAPLIHLFTLQHLRDQRGLNLTQRRQNLRHGLQLDQRQLEKVNDKLSLQHVLVVDDVMTSGATFNRAAQLLKQNGVKLVGCWALARAQKSTVSQRSKQRHNTAPPS